MIELTATARDRRTGRIYLETFGCQMNELDSELVQGHLSAIGYEFIDDAKAADIILYNTCSVRQQAENKVLSRLGLIAIEKAAGRHVVVGVLGCMAEREGAGMIRKYPQIDVLCGPGELDRLPMLLDNAWQNEAQSAHDRIALQGNRTRRSATLSAAADHLEYLDRSRAFDPDHAEAGGRSAYVRITRGCNKFCTYCVVPHTRGGEVHRPPDMIVEECQRLAQQGVIEVTLLGQTVNHYIYVHGAAIGADGQEAAQVGPGLGAFRKTGDRFGGKRVTTFAQLLQRIHEEVPEIKRLRFVTSYPRDFGDDVLQVIADSPRICRYLHVPAQSGSNRMLKLMNRGYTIEEYLAFIDRVKTFLPDAGIAGDLICGFPTESDEDHEATRQLILAVPFKNNFVFKYSPRPGTVAIDRFPDDIPDEVKRWRVNDLLDLQSEVSERVHGELVGQEVDVFVEKISRETPRRDGQVEVRMVPATVQVSGRTGGDLITVFDVPQGTTPTSLIGNVVPVVVTSAAARLLRGRLATPAGAIA